MDVNFSFTEMWKETEVVERSYETTVENEANAIQ